MTDTWQRMLFGSETWNVIREYRAFSRFALTFYDRREGLSVLLGLDVGTTATKALLFDLEGNVRASASASYGLISPQAGWVEQDPEALWRAVVAVLRSIVSQLQPGQRVLALAQSSQGGTTVPVDAAGQPTYNAISWMDGRAQAEHAELRRQYGGEVFSHKTGWPLMAGLPLQHIRWLRDEQPDTFARSRHFLFVNDFIGRRLTGELCMNPSDASITQLLDIETGDWDDWLLMLAGIRREQLSPLHPSGVAFGKLTAEASAATGLPAGLPVINGAHDQYCAAVGMRVTRPGSVLLSCGTAWVLLAVPEDLEVGRRSGMALSCHAVPGRWGAIRSLGAVGTSLDWLIDNIWAGHEALPLRIARAVPGGQCRSRSFRAGRARSDLPPAGWGTCRFIRRGAGWLPRVDANPWPRRPEPSRDGGRGLRVALGIGRNPGCRHDGRRTHHGRGRGSEPDLAADRRRCDRGKRVGAGDHRGRQLGRSRAGRDRRGCV